MKLSITGVIIIFILVYFAELGLGAGVFFYFVLPKINSLQQSQQLKIASPPQVSQKILSGQANVYNLVKQNKLDEASKSAQLMLGDSKTQSEQALSFQVIGEVFADQNNYEQAKIFFTKALSLDPNLPGVYIGLAGVNIIDKDFPKAIINAKQAIDLAPSRTDFYFALGLAYYGNGEKDKAIENVQKAIQGNPNVEIYKKTLDDMKNGTNHFQNQSTTSTQQPGPGYIRQDIDNLVSDLNQADKDLPIIQTYKGNSSYNQKTIDRIIELIPQRKALAQKLLDKMGKGLTLTQADFTTWDQYTSLTNEQSTLVNSLYNGNGGF